MSEYFVACVTVSLYQCQCINITFSPFQTFSLHSQLPPVYKLFLQTIFTVNLPLFRDWKVIYQSYFIERVVRLERSTISSARLGQSQLSQTGWQDLLTNISQTF